MQSNRCHICGKIFTFHDGITCSIPYHRCTTIENINSSPKCQTCEKLIKENHDLRNKLYLLTGEST